MCTVVCIVSQSQNYRWSQRCEKEKNVNERQKNIYTKKCNTNNNNNNNDETRSHKTTMGVMCNGYLRNENWMQVYSNWLLYASFFILFCFYFDFLRIIVCVCARVCGLAFSVGNSFSFYCLFCLRLNAFSANLKPLDVHELLLIT